MFGFQPGWLFHVTVFSSQPSVSGCISYPPDAAVAFENRRRETEFIVSPASTLVLNLRSARLTLADASRGLAEPKLFDGREDATKWSPGEAKTWGVGVCIEMGIVGAYFDV